MTVQTSQASPFGSSSPRFLPLLLLLFVGSGCAALIYEIVWLQLLQEWIGSTAYSLGVLLGTFMGGMCLGSLVLPRIISRRRHPLRAYAILELLIGCMGIGVLYAVPYLGERYTEMASGPPAIWFRAAISAACLLPPTILMGATLPAIARWIEATPSGVSWLGFFYGGNIVGAVIGCLGAGFYLLPHYDMPTATYIAMAINGVVAFVGLLLSFSTEYEPQASLPNAPGALCAEGAGWIYLSIAMSGLTGLGAEVVWTRLLAVMLGATVYTFSIILAVFLFGLGIGSSIGATAAKETARPRMALAICQFLLALGIAWAAWVIAYSLPFWPVNPGIAESPWYTFQVGLMRCLWAITPAAVLWGASFPLALRAVASEGQDPGKLVGGIYAANTVGAIIGSLAFALFIVPTFGTLGAQRILIVLCAASAVIACWPASNTVVEDEAFSQPPSSSFGWVTMIVFAVIASVSLVWTVRRMPWQAVAFGRFTATWLDQCKGDIMDEKDIPTTGGSDRYCTYVGEGMNVSVAVTQTPSGIRYFHGAGKVQASSDPQDMRLQRMLGHLSVLAHPNPDNVSDVLVVACGAGVTAGSFVPYPNVKHITIVDIEKLVPTQVTPKFGDVNYHIVDGIAENNPKTMDGKTVQVIFDDGRHFVRTTKEKYDIITSDPIDPWVKGWAALNTVEYYQMCKDHLKPGGVMSLWIPLYESDEPTSKSVLGTFFQVFKNGIIFSNDNRGEGYDAVLFGVNEDGPVQVDVDQVAQMLDKPEYQKVKTSLTDVGFGGAQIRGGGVVGGADVLVDLLGTYAGDAVNLNGWAKDAQINTDRNLRLQYLAGMAFNNYKSTEILNGMLRYYRFPTESFHGSAANIEAMKQILMESGRREGTTVGKAE